MCYEERKVEALRAFSFNVKFAKGYAIVIGLPEEDSYCYSITTIVFCQKYEYYRGIKRNFVNKLLTKEYVMNIIDEEYLVNLLKCEIDLTVSTIALQEMEKNKDFAEYDLFLKNKMIEPMKLYSLHFDKNDFDYIFPKLRQIIENNPYLSKSVFLKENIKFLQVRIDEESLNM